MESSKGYEPTSMTYEERNELERKKQYSNLLKAWKNDEWILPELVEYKPRKNKFLELSLDTQSLKQNFIPLRVPKASYSSLFASVAGELARWKRAGEEKEKETDYLRPFENKNENRAKYARRNNIDAWEISLKKAQKETINDFIKSLDREEEKPEGIE